MNEARIIRNAHHGAIEAVEFVDLDTGARVRLEGNDLPRASVDIDGLIHLYAKPDHVIDTERGVVRASEAYQDRTASPGPVAEETQLDEPPTGSDVLALPVDKIFALAEGDPEFAAAILAAEEEADKPRKTLLDGLRKIEKSEA